jgi:serine/threonine-protein kinase
MEFGPYRLERLIGRGRVGEVWLATDARLKRRVAIKALAGRDSGSGERFAREAQMTALLNHPSIVTVHDVGRHEGTRYIVMEYVDGPNLLQVISVGAARIPWAARIAVQVADALLSAHRAGVVHGEISPRSILVDQHLGLAKLTDFDLLKLASSLEGITPIDSLVGNPLYLSPEQISGERATRESDVFGLGATLYSLFTGTPPREGNGPQLFAQIRSGPAPAADRRPDVPRPISDALAQMLDPDPQRRVGALEKLIDVARPFAIGFDTPAEGTLGESAIEHPVAPPEPPAPNRLA